MSTVPSEQLLALTHEMLASAQASDWDKLAALEQARLPIFHQVFAQGIGDKVELAREVLSIDETTKRLANKQIPALQREMLTLKISGKANSVYQAIQNSAYGTD